MKKSKKYDFEDGEDDTDTTEPEDSGDDFE